MAQRGVTRDKGVNTLNFAGMGTSLGSYQSGNAGYSTFSVQAPIVSQPSAPVAPTLAPTRLQARTYHCCGLDSLPIK